MKHFHFVLLLLSCWLASDVVAQTPEPNKPIVEDNEKITALIQNYYADIASYLQDKNVPLEQVTRHLTPDYKSTRHIVLIDGRQTESNATLLDMRHQLDKFKATQGIKVEYLIEKILNVRTYENIAVIHYIMVYSILVGEERVLRLRSIVTDYAKRDDANGWRIFDSHGLNVYKSQDIGLCPVAVLQKNTDATLFEVKVLYPTGQTFTSETLTYSFTKGDGKVLIKEGENAYIMENKAITLIQDATSKQNTKVGIANNPTEAISIILAQHRFAGTCLGFRTLKP
ncbi:MAG: hypothetical protein MUE96_08730 [Bacteroidia bacterium]|jgi:hypothetical protein|nr:hypothetical protein [Bacteroidia bacterium]